MAWSVNLLIDPVPGGAPLARYETATIEEQRWG